VLYNLSKGFMDMVDRDKGVNTAVTGALEVGGGILAAGGVATAGVGSLWSFSSLLNNNPNRGRMVVDGQFDRIIDNLGEVTDHLDTGLVVCRSVNMELGQVTCPDFDVLTRDNPSDLTNHVGSLLSGSGLGEDTVVIVREEMSAINNQGVVDSVFEDQLLGVLEEQRFQAIQRTPDTVPDIAASNDMALFGAGAILLGGLCLVAANRIKNSR
jgi:hypothetical protein